MSLSAASLRTTDRSPLRGPARPPLRLVEAGRRRAAQVPFLVVCATLLMAGLVAVLLLNMTIAQGSYALDDLTKQSQTLDDQAQALRDDLDATSSSQHLAEEAAKLGMAPVAAPMFLDPETGTVSGVAKDAGVASNFTVVTGRDAATPGKTPSKDVANALSGAAGLSLGGGLVGAVSSLAG